MHRIFLPIYHFFQKRKGLMYGLICFVFRLDIGMDELEELGRFAAAAFYLLMVLTMLIYDAALRNLAILYEYRLRPHLRFPK